MTTTQPEVQPGPQGSRHGLRLFLIWIVLALAADLVIWFVWNPHLPPGDMSDAARHQQFDIAVLAMIRRPGRHLRPALLHLLDRGLAGQAR